MTINTRNPVWANPENTLIDCEIEHSKYGWIPFTASPNDTEQHGRDIFSVLSQNYVGAYVAPPAPTNEELAAFVRDERNKLLSATDWTQASDVPQSIKDLYTPYRQALRNVPQQNGFPVSVNWPVAPQ